jgi:Amt family ammonium transporter
MKMKSLAAAVILCVVFTGPSVLSAEEPSVAASDQSASWQLVANTLWVMVAAFLVFWMNAGFAMVETGFCRAKNAVNILAKNFVVFALATVVFWGIGFALMFGDGNALFGTHGFFIGGADNSALSAGEDSYQGVFHSLAWAGYLPLSVKFFFQLVFAATAATIVSGAVAERIHFPAFIGFSVVLVAVVYPVAGHWIWGGGFLAGWGFLDFAGSTTVHAVGGWAALAGALMLGPRLGKYKEDGSVNPMPGHNMALATLGGLILWLGWFGFNPGSTMQADASAIAHVALTTNLAASAGIITALITVRKISGNYDLSMIINGALAGLVAVTAPCAFVTPPAALAIGGVAGVLVVLSVIAFDRIHVDDPVGALSVHLIGGIWGTLAVGLFASPSLTPSGAGGLLYGGTQLLLVQATGVAVVALFVFPASLGGWFVLKKTVGIRVTAEQEQRGLDLSEMGMEAYPLDPRGWKERFANPLFEPVPATPPVAEAASRMTPQPQATPAQVST